MKRFIFFDDMFLNFIPRYNDWMQSEVLQQLTASEPLTLAEEYEMQKSWHLDEKSDYSP